MLVGFVENYKFLYISFWFLYLLFFRISGYPARRISGIWQIISQISDQIGIRFNCTIYIIRCLLFNPALVADITPLFQPGYLHLFLSCLHPYRIQSLLRTPPSLIPQMRQNRLPNLTRIHFVWKNNNKNLAQRLFCHHLFLFVLFLWLLVGLISVDLWLLGFDGVEDHVGLVGLVGGLRGSPGLVGRSSLHLLLVLPGLHLLQQGSLRVRGYISEKWTLYKNYCLLKVYFFFLLLRHTCCTPLSFVLFDKHSCY